MTRKSGFVVGGNLINPNQAITYISIFYQYTVSILLVIYLLNDPSIRFFNFGNKYLNSDTYENVNFVVGKKFGPEVDGKIKEVVK